MKHSLFEPLGHEYPHALEERYDRILTKIEQLWDKPEIDEYFSDLLIDKRGGRQGFPQDVLTDIVRLSQYREFWTLKQAERREYAIVELARRGIEVNADSLFHAVETGDKEQLDLLLRGGVNIHVKNKEGSPPIIVSLIKGYTVVSNMLLKAGAEVNERDRMGFTPLLLACGKSVQGFRSVAEALIKKGAFVNMKDALGNTPLLLAVSGGAVEVAELLIERGADILVANRNGETAMSLAHKAGNQHLINLLLVKQEELQEAKSKRSGNL